MSRINSSIHGLKQVMNISGYRSGRYSGVTAGTDHRLKQVSYYHYFGDRAFAGVEYRHGLLENKSEAQGTGNYIQFSLKYTFK